MCVIFNVMVWFFSCRNQEFPNERVACLTDSSIQRNSRKLLFYDYRGNGQSTGNVQKPPLYIILITYFEVLPAGLVVALISAAILKRKKPLETAAA